MNNQYSYSIVYFNRKYMICNIRKINLNNIKDCDIYKIQIGNTIAHHFDFQNKFHIISKWFK